MTVVVLAMLLCVAAAVAVLAVVAIPRVRGGDKVLTPEGEAAVRDAQRRARAIAADARGRAEDARSRRPRDAAAPAADTAPPEDAAPEDAPPEKAASEDAARRTEPAEPSEPRPPDGPRPTASTDERRAEHARERIARGLEWSEPEPGPRHRR